MNTFFLANTPLFHGITEKEISEMLTCLNARERKFKKDEVIFRAGESVKEIGLVESGGVNIVVNFYWGNSHIFGHVSEGQIFAESYAAIPGKELVYERFPAQMLSLSESVIIFCQHIALLRYLFVRLAAFSSGLAYFLLFRFR